MKQASTDILLVSKIRPESVGFLTHFGWKKFFFLRCPYRLLGNRGVFVALVGVFDSEFLESITLLQLRCLGDGTEYSTKMPEWSGSCG